MRLFIKIWFFLSLPKKQKDVKGLSVNSILHKLVKNWRNLQKSSLGLSSVCISHLQVEVETESACVSSLSPFLNLFARKMLSISHPEIYNVHQVIKWEASICIIKKGVEFFHFNGCHWYKTCIFVKPGSAYWNVRLIAKSKSETQC